MPRPRVCCCQASHQRSEFWALGPPRILSQIAIRWGFNPNGKNNVLVKSAVITNTVYILWTSNDYIFHSHKQRMPMNALCDSFRHSNWNLVYNLYHVNCLHLQYPNKSSCYLWVITGNQLMPLTPVFPTNSVTSHSC